MSTFKQSTGSGSIPRSKLLKVLIVFSLRSSTHNTFCSRSEVDNPIAAKKRRDDAETKKQQAEALRLQEEAKKQKKEDELQKSYQIAIQKNNEVAMQRKLAASNQYQAAVDENCIKIYADGLRGFDDDTILQLFKIFGKAFLECRANGGGAALLVMECDAGERAIRQLDGKQTKEGHTRLTVNRAFNQEISTDARMQLSDDDLVGKYIFVDQGTKTKKQKVAFEEHK